MKTYGKKLYCIDEKLKLHGDYNSEKALKVEVVFEKCNNQTIVPANTCHSDEDLKQWMMRKFIIVVQNEIQFQIVDYSENKIKPIAKLIWHPFSSWMR